MKPKIQLVGGCASSFVNEVVTDRVSKSDNDSVVSSSTRGGEAGVLLEQFLQIIMTSVGASAGVVRVVSPNGCELRTVGSRGLSDDLCKAESAVDKDCGVCGKSAASSHVESSSAEFCKSIYGDDFFGTACKFLLAVPFGKGDTEGEIAGVVTLFFAEEQQLNELQKQTLQSYANLIHAALKSVWHTEDGHQGNLLAERQSIANEIHDSLAQTLYYAKIRASLLIDAMKSDNELLAYKCAQDIEEALEGSQKTVRELVTHFRCQMDPKGLKYALQKLVKDFIARTGIPLEYINPLDNLVLPLEFELQIFLIVRESLVNIATHAKATAASLNVSRKGNSYEFSIRDNGAGVNTSAPTEGHYGLEIMHERALRIGGEVVVESTEGLGTRVQLIFTAPGA